MARSLECIDFDGPLERLTHRPPQSLVALCREKIVLLALKAVRRIQSGSRLGWLGWPFTCIPNFEPKGFKYFILNLNLQVVIRLEIIKYKLFLSKPYYNIEVLGRYVITYLM